MIRYLFVAGLNGRKPQEFRFQDDINVITGPNGSGKTTLLKLIWYLISGNIERIPREMYFDEVSLETSEFKIRIAKTKSPRKDENVYDFTYCVDGRDRSFPVELEDIAIEVPPVREANHTISQLGGSLFFSTFRRLEGGFSMTPTFYPIQRRRRVSGRTARLPSRDQLRYFREKAAVEHVFHGPDLQPRLHEMASSLSLYNHHFVASISTNDIVGLLTRKYAEISETTNRNHSELSNFILSVIREYSDVTARAPSEQDLAFAKSSLDRIANEVERIDRHNQRLLRPFSILSGLIAKIMRGRGVRITENIILGGKESGVDSSLLSSGEKHMLSFLCYNAFYNGMPIFIDEPEISLHVDWQRMLFPTLLAQETDNQFITATHSPFIYSKYQDREFELEMD